MPRQAIRQATCTECDESDDNHKVTDTDMSLSENTITHTTRCNCGAEGEVTITENETIAGENISHEDASWNDEDEDDE